jgi:hypothetical protein
MPRAISVIRKYFPALSNDDSFPSSHLSCRGNLKPFGGGPVGVAERVEDVEKGAELAISLYVTGTAFVGRVRDSATAYFAVAIVLSEEWSGVVN